MVPTPAARSLLMHFVREGLLLGGILAIVAVSFVLLAPPSPTGADGASAAFSEPGSRLLTQSDHPVYDLSISEASGRVLVRNFGELAALHNLETGAVVQSLPSLPEDTSIAVLSPDGGTLLVGEDDGTVGFLKTSAPNDERPLDSVHQGGVTAAAFSADGRLAITSADVDPHVLLWNVETGEIVERFDAAPLVVEIVAFSADARYIVAGLEGHRLLVWEVGSDAPPSVIEGASVKVVGVAVTPDAEFVLSTAVDGRVSVWERATGNLVQQARPAGAGAATMALSDDGRRIAVGNLNGDVFVYESPSLTLLRNGPMHRKAVIALCFSHDGKTLYTAGHDGAVREWKL